MAARASASQPPRGVSARRPFRLIRTTRTGATAPPAVGVRWTAARMSLSTPTCPGGRWSQGSGTRTAVVATRHRTTTRPTTSASGRSPVRADGPPSRRVGGGGAASRGDGSRQRSARRRTRTTPESGRSTGRRTRGTPAADGPTPGRTGRSPALSRTGVPAARPLAVPRSSGRAGSRSPPRASRCRTRSRAVPPGVADVRRRNPGPVRRPTHGFADPTGRRNPNRRTRLLWIRGTPRVCMRGHRRPARTAGT